MSEINVYQVGPSGWFEGQAIAFESPREPGVFLIPEGCVEVEPELVDGLWPKWIDGAWLNEQLPEAPEPVADPPQELSDWKIISDRQFFHGLAILGLISRAEALAAVKVGELPASFASLLEGMDEDEKFNAEMFLTGATRFERDHPLTAYLAERWGMSGQEIDDLFRLCWSL